MKPESSKSIKSTFRLQYLPPLITSLILGVLPKNWADSGGKKLAGLPPRVLLSTVAILATICVSQWCILYSWKSKRLLLKRYQREDCPPGVYSEKCTGEKVCGVCLNKGVVSPLTTNGAKGFWCNTCNLPLDCA